MLNYIAATLLILVGLFHSLIGGKRLIAPIVAREDLPVILGSVEMSRMTLRVGWHMLTLFWFALALILMALAQDLWPLEQLVLGGFGGLFVLSGFAALVFGRGKHLSWAFFLPIGAILLYQAV